MWTITKKLSGGNRLVEVEISAGLSCIEAFVKACDMGFPGEYQLRSKSGITLAVASVQRDEFQVRWHAGWIFYALGEEGLAGEVVPVSKVLREQSALELPLDEG